MGKPVSVPQMQVAVCKSSVQDLQNKGSDWLVQSLRITCVCEVGGWSVGEWSNAC